MKKLLDNFIRYPVEGLFIMFIYSIFKLMPLDTASKLGSIITKAIGPNLNVNKVILRNLKRAYPDMNDAWYKKINNETWDNFGRVAAEYSHISTLASTKSDRIKIIENEHFKKFFDDSGSKILVSAHNANWEVMGITCRKKSNKISGIVRQPNNPYARNIINSLRDKFSVKCYEKNMIGTKKIINDFNNGNSLALLADLKLNSGIDSKFFDINAKTTTLPAQIALKYKRQIYLAWAKRTQKSNFEVEFFSPINSDNIENNSINIKKITDQINQFFEKKISENPGQYFWLHNRW